MFIFESSERRNDMNMLDAIEQLIREAGCPLTVVDITRSLLKRGLWQTSGKTPEATVGARLYMAIKKGDARFVKAGKSAFGLSGMKVGKFASVQEKAQKSLKRDDVGYVYILTNPSFRKDWVKIGMTERPVNTRSKELDNTAVPLPFEIFATLHTKHRRRIENLHHGMIDDFDPNARIRKSREFFNINPDLALRLLKRAAEAFDEEANICDVFNKAVEEVNPSSRKPFRISVVKAKSPNAAKNTTPEWKNVTQLARWIAIQGGNEGAAGGVAQLLTAKRRCIKSSKWRKPMENLGIKFDQNDFVQDWEHARKPL